MGRTRALEVNFTRRIKFLVAGDIPHDVEDFLFMTARRFGAVCARISGYDAWLQMLSSLEFVAVFVGVDAQAADAPAILARGREIAPGMPIVTIGGPANEHSDYHLDFSEIGTRLPGIVEKLATSTRAARA